MTDTIDLDSVDLGASYRRVRRGLSAFLTSGADPEAPVPACPGWTVHDVVAHLVAVPEDVMAGRLTGPPDSEFTAAQVARRRDSSIERMVAEWEQMAPPFEELVGGMKIWPAYLDVLGHEHDIRGALNAPAGRDGEDVRVAAVRLVNILSPSVPIEVRVDGSNFRPGPKGDPAVSLDTSSFEAFRFRLGRRSRSQMAAMSWRGDPVLVLDELAIFGPAEADVVE
ncbi:MAG: maleylpyruvate isomerase family mycothiol-dependent enzyme [Acidimicrobiales bacterium]